MDFFRSLWFFFFPIEHGQKWPRVSSTWRLCKFILSCLYFCSPPYSSSELSLQFSSWTEKTCKVNLTHSLEQRHHSWPEDPWVKNKYLFVCYQYLGLNAIMEHYCSKSRLMKKKDQELAHASQWECGYIIEYMNPTWSLINLHCRPLW